MIGTTSEKILSEFTGPRLPRHAVTAPPLTNQGWVSHPWTPGRLEFWPPMRNMDDARRLWELSDEMVGVWFAV
ncbi:hypothetical protein [Pseudonocardia kunmingensis]|uniref:hypothetical protein n=1 Tax=Pseudonocardia kunmingensis TaxID=630975 RepID=UPI00147816BD|nr:hypothetical protein [Pseudonocardia kunmingensis]